MAKKSNVKFWIFFLLFIILCMLRKDKVERMENQMMNLYGEPLEPCRDENNSEDLNGSWDDEGRCSELTHGVHQICFDVNENTKEFSTQTNQNDWSLSRNGKNHCMCLGAWALFKAKQFENILPETNNELKCESIPDISITDEYINKWNTWNSHELSDQIIHGVNKMIEQCYEKGNHSQKEVIKHKYLNFVQNKQEFHSTDLYLSFL